MSPGRLINESNNIISWSGVKIYLQAIKVSNNNKDKKGVWDICVENIKEIKIANKKRLIPSSSTIEFFIGCLKINLFSILQ